MMSDSQTVTLPSSAAGDVTYDLARLNRALDVHIECGGDERQAAYALVHADGWPPTEATVYAEGALWCAANGIDPNDPPRILRGF